MLNHNAIFKELKKKIIYLITRAAVVMMVEEQLIGVASIRVI